ncbi:MAG: hypothetical protein IPL65_10595 [Lewinellaceae bacterium]|nr:hypothetical protein [Lewinellaceae bacterium]
MTNLPINTSITITLGYDIKHGDKHAIDYLTHYNYMLPHAVCSHGKVECTDPIAGITGIVGATTTFPIPNPDTTNTPAQGQPLLSFLNHPARYMTMFGGTITDIQYGVNGDLTASQSETTIKITFTSNGSTAVLAFGGHIASSMDWGAGNAAGGISGSPYHMRTKDWTLDNLGNQDRSMSSAAVAPSCDITGQKTVCAGSTNQYCSPLVSGQSYLWSVSGDASILGSDAGNCVSIHAGSDNYTLTLQVSSGNNGLCTSCTYPVIVQGGLNCTITGPGSVCPGSTAQFCGPANADSYAWSVSGNGTISGAANQQCVNIAAGNACGSYTVTLVITNGSCSSTCAELVLTEDFTPPPISCPANVTVACANMVPGINIGSVTAGPDNCGGTIGVTHIGDIVSNQTCSNRFTLTRTYRAIDICSNTATCKQTITVFDGTPPSIACPQT